MQRPLLCVRRWQIGGIKFSYQVAPELLRSTVRRSVFSLTFLHRSRQPCLVGQIGCHEVALARTELVQPLGCLLELALFPAGNDHSRTVLNECLSSHFSEAGSSTCDQNDMIFEAEED